MFLIGPHFFLHNIRANQNPASFIVTATLFSLDHIFDHFITSVPETRLTFIGLYFHLISKLANQNRLSCIVTSGIVFIGLYFPLIFKLANQNRVLSCHDFHSFISPTIFISDESKPCMFNCYECNFCKRLFDWLFYL